MESIALMLFVLSAMIVFTLVTVYGHKKGYLDYTMSVLYICVMGMLLFIEGIIIRDIVKEFFVRIAHIIAYMNF